MIAKHWQENIIELKGYNDKIAILKFRITQDKTLSLIQIYAPTSTYTDNEAEEYYDNHNKACHENKGT